MVRANRREEEEEAQGKRIGSVRLRSQADDDDEYRGTHGDGQGVHSFPGDGGNNDALSSINETGNDRRQARRDRRSGAVHSRTGEGAIQLHDEDMLPEGDAESTEQ